ncbi:TadE/TadG family type IV pilus assembly protein [Erythrobacteraceae bacterium WH01K]|nr:TadE/TadG family type IV pilus assembly protein [Erythrobacteraceae bacterium WH01K]
MSVNSHLDKLRSDKNGATIVEFAMVSPVLLLVLMGIFDLAFNLYLDAVLQGAMQKAGRDGSIEASDYDKIDNDVKTQVGSLISDPDIEFSRTSYNNFSDVWNPEDFVDENGDGICNDGEVFEDSNGNGVHDGDRGTAGGGGAQDAVVYEARITYDRVFPLARMIALPEKVTAVGVTVMRNQPFELREIRPSTENCS